MSPSRRDFIRMTGFAGAGLAFGGASLCSASTGKPASRRLLILGGTGFIGPHMVRYAVDRGHQVTIFTRGNRKPDLPDSVEQLVGDRNDDLTALEGRSWDVVLDNNARDYRWVQKSTALLANATRQYLFVSSISAYELEEFGWANAGQVLNEPLVDESYKRFGKPVDWNDGDEAPYGLTKALSEDIVHQVFGQNATIVRPGLIVGPGDPTDRWTYWPVRLKEGGEVLAPGNPDHANQIIDQRDLTEWIVRLAENGTSGDFNATGPAQRLSMGSMLEQIGDAVGTPHQLTWVPESFLEQQQVAPWSDIPSWIPGDPLMFVDVSRAVAAGLTYRSLARTTLDTLAWDASRPAEARENRKFGMSREREREVLAAWHATQG